MIKHILIKPLFSEKSEAATTKLHQYTFAVNKAANKLEIKKAIESTYGVSVDAVNTITTASKIKVRNTKSGIVRGKKASIKKAIVTLSEGEDIDFFGE